MADSALVAGRIRYQNLISKFLHIGFMNGLRPKAVGLTLNSNDHIERLFARINYEKQTRVASDDFKLNQMLQFLKQLGDPHLKCPVVHVAGTKGKGSVCAFAGSILAQAGYKVGIYTSPHLERINQRIQLDGLEISDQQLNQVLAKLDPVLRQMDAQTNRDGSKPLTFFEVITGVAFQFFADAGADAVVLEVGMGGRLDSTNVCQPEVCVITNISLDHTRQLGASTDKIAAEKAGILKPGVPAICGETNELPKRVIHDIAHSVGCSLYQLDRDFRIDSSQSDFEYWSQIAADDEKKISKLQPSMAGAHQQTNAALAIAACEALIEKGWGISEENVSRGIRGASLPGRCEIISGDPTFILDMAHNEASATALSETLASSVAAFAEAQSRTMIFAASREKDVEKILSPLLPMFDRVIVTKYQENPRGRSAQEVLDIAQNLETGSKVQIEIATLPAEALEKAKRIDSPDHVVCITGSVFLVAELRSVLIAKSGIDR